jgi:glyoxylase-like metal-dependent hydrolase (beta-lactamase superfamily II)
METIQIPDSDVLPLDLIALGVKGLRIIFVNVYAIENDEGGWTLIDAGIPGSAGRIKSWAEEAFGEDSKPDQIILTHGHFDHVGAIEDLLKDWNVPVYAHADELAFLTGLQGYPPPDPSVGGGLMAVLSPLYPRAPKNLGSRVAALPADGTVPGLPGWRWIHTPGHTPGHVSFYREHDGTLLVGDAFCTAKAESFLAVAIEQKPELSGPPAYYTPDWDAASASVKKLAALKPRTLAPGHGKPMSGPEVLAGLEDLAARFDQIARPVAQA